MITKSLPLICGDDDRDRHHGSHPLCSLSCVCAFQPLLSVSPALPHTMGKGNVAKAKIARERKLKAAAKAGNAGGGKAGMKARMGSGQGHQCNICKVRGHAARCLCDPDWLQCMVTCVLCGVFRCAVLVRREAIAFSAGFPPRQQARQVDL